MLVAGGTGSIGAEIAALAAAQGWSVAVHGRTRASVSAALGKLREAVPGGCFEGFPELLDKAGGAPRLVEKVGARLGRIDALVDCVSYGPPGVVGPFAGTDPAAFAGLTEASLVHLQRLAHAALPWLKRGGGTLIAFASDAGLFAAPRQSLIGASRAGIIGFVRNLAMEVARDAVRVHCISPSFVEGSESMRRVAALSGDRMEKARGRAGLGLPTAADIAPAVLFLCGEGARRITGQVISINGGLNA